MLRAPRPGRVKTRIAAHLGDQTALALYRACVEDMMDALAGCGAHVIGMVDPADALEEVRHWLPGLEVAPQTGGGLGARLCGAFAHAFSLGYPAAAALGSDLPEFTPWHARQLARLTRSEPAHIGPSPDGGFWTIGFQAASYTPDVFTDIPWSTPEVFEAAMRRMEALQPAQLPLLGDMDTVEDVLRLTAAPCHALGKRIQAAVRNCLTQAQ